MTRAHGRIGEHVDEQRLRFGLAVDASTTRWSISVDGRARAGDLDAHRIVQQFRGQLRDRRPASSPRTAASAARGRHHRDDPPHVVDEAHVEHAVGFVEHETLRPGRGAERAGRIRSSSRPGVATRMSTPRPEALICGCWPTPPKMTRVRQAHVAAVHREAVANLDREFARRRQDQGARLRPARRGPASATADAASAARTRPSCRCRSGRAEQIAALEQEGDGLRLDGRGGRILRAFNARRRGWRGRAQQK